MLVLGTSARVGRGSSRGGLYLLCSALFSRADGCHVLLFLVAYVGECKLRVMK